MSNQWFYIRQWTINRECMWAIISSDGEIIKENINKYEAEDIKYKLEKENANKRYHIVNKQDSRYSEMVSYNKLKSGNSHENN